MGQFNMSLCSLDFLAPFITRNTMSSTRELSGHIIIEVDGNMETLVHDSFIIEIPHAIFIAAGFF